MTSKKQKLVTALHKTANKLEHGQKYQWGHMGSCNCGNLAQELTNLSKAEIHRYALLSRSGDWADQVSAFCPNSGLHMDIIIEEMLRAGLTREDLINLERLSDKKVLSSLPIDERHLEHNKKSDVVKYLRAWADLLTTEITQKEEQIKLHKNATHMTEGSVSEKEYIAEAVLA